MLVLHDGRVVCVETLPEHALRGHLPRQGIGEPTFAWQDDIEGAAWLEEPGDLFEGSREIDQMLQHVNGDDAIEELVGPRLAFVDIAVLHPSFRKCLPEFSTPVLAILQTVVLLSREIFVVVVRPEPGADLECPPAGLNRECCYSSMVETFDQIVAPRQFFEPETHEFFTLPLLFPTERRGPFRPVGADAGRPGYEPAHALPDGVSRRRPVVSDLLDASSESAQRSLAMSVIPFRHRHARSPQPSAANFAAAPAGGYDISRIRRMSRAFCQLPDTRSSRLSASSRQRTPTSLMR